MLEKFKISDPLSLEEKKKSEDVAKMTKNWQWHYFFLNFESSRFWCELC